MTPEEKLWEQRVWEKDGSWTIPGKTAGGVRAGESTRTGGGRRRTTGRCGAANHSGI